MTPIFLATILLTPVAYLVLAPSLPQRAVRLLFGLSAFSYSFAILLWPPATAMIIDHALRIAGSGRLVSHALFLSTDALFFAGISVATGTWSQTRGRVLYAGCLLLVLYVIFWSLAHLPSAQTAVGVYYEQGRSSFWPSGLMNVTMGIGMMYISTAVSVIAALFLKDTKRRQERMVASLVALLFAIGTCSGLITVVEALAWNPGRDTDTFYALQALVQASTVGVLIALTLVLCARRLLISIRQLSAKIEAPIVDAISNDLAVLGLMIGERGTSLFAHEHSHHASVYDVSKLCLSENFSPHQRHVALEATRWSTFSRANMIANAEVRTSAGQEPETKPTERSDLPLSLQLTNKLHLYADTAHVILLLLAPATLLPEVARPRRGGWHQQMASLIGPVLRAHDQPDILQPTISSTLTRDATPPMRFGPGRALTWVSGCMASIQDGPTTFRRGVERIVASDIFTLREQLVALNLIISDRELSPYPDEIAYRAIIRDVTARAMAQAMTRHQRMATVEASR